MRWYHSVRAEIEASLSSCPLIIPSIKPAQSPTILIDHHPSSQLQSRLLSPPRHHFRPSAASGSNNYHSKSRLKALHFHTDRFVDMVQITFFVSALVVTAGIALALPSPVTPLLSGHPVGTSDGLYLGDIAADGSTTWTLALKLNTTASTNTLAARDFLLTKRDFVSCPGFGLPTLPDGDTFGARDALVNLCGSGFFFNNRAVSLARGLVVAFGCNYGNGQVCHGGL